jgi:gluconolactonase
LSSSALAPLLAPGAAPELLATGFVFTEGPVWRADGSLHFSDIPASRRHRWHPDEGVTVLRDPNDMGNGMTLDTRGDLLVCRHATSMLVRERTDGSVEIVASHWQGRELNSPNDVIARSDGSIYFTDPFYGRLPIYGIPRERELDFQGVYRVAPEGELQLVADDFAMPNGLCFAPDETRLYVNDTERSHIRVFDVRADGSLADGRVFFAGVGSALPGEEVDGMKADERGNVYVTGPRGIWVVDPGGTHLGTIELPETVGNMAWGGADGRTLFVCASTSLYALRMSVRGSGVGAP